MPDSAQPIVNLPYLAINEIIPAYSTTTALTLTAGVCRDQTNVWDINIGNYGGIVANVTANTSTTINGAANGLNGLDTGSLAAATLYYIYVVGDVISGNTTGAIISTSGPSVGPLMPFGYNVFRLVGYIRTAGGGATFIKGFYSGNGNFRLFKYELAQVTAITAGNATAYTNISLAISVPPVENTPVYISSDYIPQAAGNILNVKGFNESSSAISISVTGQVATVHVTSTQKILAQLNSGVPTVSYKVGNAGDAVAINVWGYDYYI